MGVGACVNKLAQDREAMGGGFLEEMCFCVGTQRSYLEEVYII